MKLLITGASGLYGSKLAKLALDRGIEVYSSDIQGLSVYGNFVKLDITDKVRVEEVFCSIKPDVVVHAASLTDVDKCELNKELAWRVNVDGTKHVAEASRQAGSFLVYISTDYVFSGEKGCYVESDSPEPLNYYGLTKLEAETVVMQTMAESDFFIGRPSVIYGATPAAGKVNFALWLIEALRKGERVRIVVDQWNTPTLNTNLAEMTLEVLERRLNGVFHTCGATRVSRFEFATMIADCFGLDKSLIDRVSAVQFSWPAKRPTDSSLDTSLAQRTFNCKPLQMGEALERLKSELNAKQAPV
ncbi:MAG TPA: dTDP-4-dehydrorhamnose reductase [Candidatus Acidoferrales bacterium]|nr:dTDP-4-dehydrorhamnose reductase [Candidatus Acidoferrales bacterium]